MPVAYFLPPNKYQDLWTFLSFQLFAQGLQKSVGNNCPKLAKKCFQTSWKIAFWKSVNKILQWWSFSQINRNSTKSTSSQNFKSLGPHSRKGPRKGTRSLKISSHLDHICRSKGIRSPKISSHSDHICRSKGIRSLKISSHSDYICRTNGTRSLKIASHSEHICRSKGIRSLKSSSHSDHICRSKGIRSPKISSHSDYICRSKWTRSLKISSHSDHICTSKGIKSPKNGQKCTGVTRN